MLETIVGGLASIFGVGDAVSETVDAVASWVVPVVVGFGVVLLAILILLVVLAAKGRK